MKKIIALFLILIGFSAMAFGPNAAPPKVAPSDSESESDSDDESSSPGQAMPSQEQPMPSTEGALEPSIDDSDSSEDEYGE